MEFSNYLLWCGSEESLHEYLAVIKKFEGMSAKDFVALTDANDETVAEEQLPRLLSIDGDIAFVQVEGMLTNKVSWWNKYAGLVAYQEIREAMVAAAAHEGVREIFMLVRSPGGIASGMLESAELTKKINRIKPITAFTDGNMASAAYAISVPAKRVYASQDASVGSIGTLRITVDYTEMMKKDGIKAKVFRSGELKAVGIPYEKLSDKAAKSIQDKVDYLADAFMDVVAEARGVNIQKIKNLEGDYFIGAQAKEVGLVDDIKSFDAVLGAMQKRIARRTKTSGGFSMKKTYAVTAKSLAALAEQIASGASLDEVVGDVDGLKDVAEELKDSEASGDAQAAAEGASEGEAQAAAESDGAGEGDAQAKKDEPDAESSADTSAVEVLQAQISSLEDKLISAKVELNGMQARIESFEAHEKDLKEIVASETAGMMVALNIPAPKDLAERDTGDLVGLYRSTLEEHIEAFKVGRQSSEAAEGAADTKETSPKITRLEQARLRSVRRG